MIHITFSLLKIFFYAALRKKIISSRCACLGLDSLVDYILINRQKYRIDLPWNRCLTEIFFSVPKINSKILPPIRNLVFQQIFNLWKISIKYSDFFIMDTYSELTDRKYTIDDFIFCCHKSDLNHESSHDVKGGALISPESLYDNYKNFFEKILSINKKIKIIVILFPVKFETREKYQLQYIYIRKALLDCLDIGIQVIELPISDIHKDPIDEYPYHFNSKTIDSFKALVLNAMKNL